MHRAHVGATLKFQPFYEPPASRARCLSAPTRAAHAGCVSASTQLHQVRTLPAQHCTADDTCSVFCRCVRLMYVPVCAKRPLSGASCSSCCTACWPGAFLPEHKSRTTCSSRPRTLPFNGNASPLCAPDSPAHQPSWHEHPTARRHLRSQRRAQQTRPTLTTKAAMRCLTRKRCSCWLQPWQRCAAPPSARTYPPGDTTHLSTSLPHPPAPCVCPAL
jgi:hypothetical protein